MYVDLIMPAGGGIEAALEDGIADRDLSSGTGCVPAVRKVCKLRQPAITLYARQEQTTTEGKEKF